MNVQLVDASFALNAGPRFDVIAAHDGYRIGTWTGQAVATITGTSRVETRPTWTVVLAICCFPIGLLFLLIKNQQDVTTYTTTLQDSGGHWVRVIGDRPLPALSPFAPPALG